MAEILFFGNAPEFPGFNQVNFRVPGRRCDGVRRSRAVDVPRGIDMVTVKLGGKKK